MSAFEAEFARRNQLCHTLDMVRCLKDSHFPEMRAQAIKAIENNVSQVQEHDRDWIRCDEVRALVWSLDPAKPKMTLAILAAMELVGDDRAIHPVEGLLGRVLEAQDENAEPMRKAAFACLAALRERASRGEEAGGLLRGSQRPGGDADSYLLRAADGSSKVDASELLRADPTVEEIDARNHCEERSDDCST